MSVLDLKYSVFCIYLYCGIFQLLPTYMLQFIVCHQSDLVMNLLNLYTAQRKLVLLHKEIFPHRKE